jgi:flagellar basal-body rod protein FlgF
MDAAGYATLSRQSGLMREMEVVAHNLANLSTAGFRREGVVFSEFLRDGGAGPALSMGRADTRAVDLTEGPLTQTGATFDFAIRGAGFFMVETPEGPRLTRAGSFTPSAEGELVTPDGHRLLDAGGAPVAIPAGARSVMLAPDGALSADGLAVAQVGLWSPADPNSLRHEAGTLFSANRPQPAEGATLLQGRIEESNVDPVPEIARMIAVQRAYEAGQSFLAREDERMRSVIQTLGR